ncbi:cytochrome c oxidase assembly protein [Leucobacter chromiiresistens]|uniref:Cytochrome c oxidase assembly factor CtaG n=1 Tax=Leucobacter chromiiresistens TaxID=1079994 RepID=A0A1H0YGV4_9MICO|nr:cytochrome c oxidase assembly protein [Leucobacter chromiiresistens]SDQ14382.1 Cytochrome c oxidase assembly factor CtaG [Leucobacter chromiiresistens]
MYPAKASLELGDLFQFDLLSVSPLAWLAIVCLALYLAGAISLWMRRKRWGISSTLLFTFGCVIWFAATGLTANAYAEELVAVLLFQQITLMVVVPPFLLMGSPGRLLLRSTPRRGVGRPVLRLALCAYRSRTARVLLHPATVIIIAVLAFPTLYFTDTVSWFLELPSGHLILLTLFLAFGMIGAAPLWSLDPLPRAPSFVVRIVDVLLEIQIHATFGLILLRSTEPMFRWYAADPDAWKISRALDQAIAGGLIWSYGELPLIIVLIVTISKWRTSDLRQAKRREAQEDAELDAYNAYLASKFGKEQ